MEVLDIVQSAAFKAGIISSFNPDELPEDVLSAGKNALITEILPSLNCDRTVDITVTSRTYIPKGGVIKLTPFKQPAENFIILGHTHYTSTQLLEGNGAQGRSIWGYALQEIDANLVSELAHSWNRGSDWPINDLNEYATLALWTSDMRLVYSDTVFVYPTMHQTANIDFPPMRIDSVIEVPSRVKYDYVYRDEYERIVGNTAIPGIYTTEEYEDSIMILIKGSSAPKVIVLPVPLQVVDCDHERPGTIKAPEKFRRYLIDCTAVSLAIIYGVSTLPAMQQQAAVSYNLIKKNKPQPLHEANPALEICDKLRRNPLGRRFYADI